MKWMGAALLVFMGAAAGVIKTTTIRRRIELLEELVALIEYIRAELRQRGTPLPDLLDQYRASTFPLKRWAEELREGKTALRVVEPWLIMLEPDTGRVLFDLCSVLGRYDGETQVQACQRAAQLLEEQAERLRRQLAEKGRLYHTVPLSLGLMAALALF